MNSLPFTKMHGAGNDFIIIDNRNQILSDATIIELAPQLCHRRFGIGADGIIALQPADARDVDYTMFYRNADGSDAGMCGNGARCLALFAASLGMGQQLKFNVHDQIYAAKVESDRNYVTLSFPMQVAVDRVDIGGQPKIYQLHAGTEHIVLEVPETNFKDDETLRDKGRAMRRHSRFNPPGTNVNFIIGDSPDQISIKTFEKGVEDLTLACGTGAIASAITWHAINRSENQANSITVEAAGGTLRVRFSCDDKGHYSDITLGGAAQFVFEGTYEM